MRIPLTFRARNAMVWHSAVVLESGGKPPHSKAAAEEIFGSVERLNRFVYLNSHREKGEFARRPPLFAPAADAKQGMRSESHLPEEHLPLVEMPIR